MRHSLRVTRVTRIYLTFSVFDYGRDRNRGFGRYVMTREQNELLTSKNKVLENRLLSFEKLMNETQISILENQFSEFEILHKYELLF